MKTIRCSITGIQYPTVACERCHGTGSVPSGHLGFYGPVYRDCARCDGTGAKLAPVDDPRWAIFDAEHALWEAVHPEQTHR